MKFEIKQACFICYACFTATTVVSVAVAFALGFINLGVVGYFASIALMCLFPFLQLLWFTPTLIHKASYTARVVGFGLTYLPILVMAALLGRWFEPSLGSWAIFVGIYLVILLGMTLGFHRYYRHTSGSYQAALERYHKRKASEKPSESH